MLKRVGVLALMLCGGAAFLCPKPALAQNYGAWYSYTPQPRYEGGFYYSGERFRDEHQEHKWRERERREQERRERDWRRHERWERGWYGAGYDYAPRVYYGNPYCPR
jgi:hypothetical protein